MENRNQNDRNVDRNNRQTEKQPDVRRQRDEQTARNERQTDKR